MNDREKVIKGLECCGETMNCNECPYDSEMGGCFRNLKADALNLLKYEEPRVLVEQETLKPTISVDTWICSQCGHTLESQELIDDKENPQVLIHEQYNYCPNCGRAVKWG